MVTAQKEMQIYLYACTRVMNNLKSSSYHFLGVGSRPIMYMDGPGYHTSGH